MRQLMFPGKDELVMADVDRLTADFTRFVERQAFQMERSGRASEARYLRRWVVELREQGVEKRYAGRDPLLSMSSGV